MSADNEAEEMMMQCCASCGIAGGDDITLKDCSACHLVRYCGVKCQKDHRKQHKKECKKRAAELLKDEILFKQPESSHYGDCPICCLPLPIVPGRCNLMACCCKIICDGCDYANKTREIEGRLQQKCAFCRKALHDTEEEKIERLMKRIGANDALAIRYMGTERYQEGDCRSAFEYWTRAAALGDVTAHYILSITYGEGKVVEKDEKREMHHAEQAAIGGHPEARHNLGLMEWESGKADRAVKHWIIAARLGYDGSLENVKVAYKAGYASKEDFAAALHGYKTAVDETKSPQREEAAELYKKYHGE